MNLMVHSIGRLLLAAAGAASLLSACGGGDGLGSGGTGAAAPTFATGTVDGFGSVFVAGERCDDLRAKVAYDTVPGGPEPAHPDLRLGQRVELDLDGSSAACRVLAARIAPEVIGLVSSTAPLMVAGAEVLVNADPLAGPVTMLDGYDSAADIAVGDRVEVHGKAVATVTGVAIRASRIERQPAVETWVRVAGVIQNLTPATFSLGHLNVHHDGGTTIVPAGFTLRNGLTVAMWSVGPVSPTGDVDARFIRVLRRQFADQQKVRLAGPISGCGSASPCSEPVIDGVPVSITPSTVFVHGSAGAIADGRDMIVAGAYDAAAGKLVATHAAIRRFDPDVGVVTLIGLVSDYSSDGTTANFRVRGVPVTTDGSTRYGANCSSGDLDDGKLVAIAGRISGSSVLASRVECPPNLEVGAVVEAYGRVLALDPAAKTFRILAGAWSLAATLHWDDDTIFNNFGGAALADDQFVFVRGVYLGGGQFLLKRVVLDDTRPSCPPGCAFVFGTLGIAHHVTPTSLIVNRIPMAIVPGTTQLPAGPIANGTIVRAWFYRDVANARWVALRVRPVVW